MYLRFSPGGGVSQHTIEGDVLTLRRHGDQFITIVGDTGYRARSVSAEQLIRWGIRCGVGACGYSVQEMASSRHPKRWKNVPGKATREEKDRTNYSDCSNEEVSTQCRQLAKGAKNEKRATISTYSCLKKFMEYGEQSCVTTQQCQLQMGERDGIYKIE